MSNRNALAIDPSDLDLDEEIDIQRDYLPPLMEPRNFGHPIFYDIAAIYWGNPEVISLQDAIQMRLASASPKEILEIAYRLGMFDRGYKVNDYRRHEEIYPTVAEDGVVSVGLGQLSAPDMSESMKPQSMTLDENSLVTLVLGHISDLIKELTVDEKGKKRVERGMRRMIWDAARHQKNSIYADDVEILLRKEETKRTYLKDQLKLEVEA